MQANGIRSSSMRTSGSSSAMARAYSSSDTSDRLTRVLPMAIPLRMNWRSWASRPSAAPGSMRMNRW